MNGDAFSVAGSADVEDAVQRQLDEHCVFAGEVSGLRAYSCDGVPLCVVPWDTRKRLFVAGPSLDKVQVVVQRLGLDWERDFDQA